jgi:hypothetical protein
MQELRLITAIDDGARLLLRSLDGSEYTLPLDEKLKAAIRGDRVRLGQIEIETDTPLRPRDIQARIRGGESAAEVAAAAGIPLERVRRYEGPVLAEREHMAGVARRTAARGSVVRDGPAPLLGDLVARRLRNLGVDPAAASWDSWRRDDGHWQVAVAYRRPPVEPSDPRSADAADRHDSSEDATDRAQFVFDPARRMVVPDDDCARLLVDEQPVGSDDAVVAGVPHNFRALAEHGHGAEGTDEPPDLPGDRRQRGGQRPTDVAGDSADHRLSTTAAGQGRSGGAGQSAQGRGDAGRADPASGSYGAHEPAIDGTGALGPGASYRPGRPGAARYSEDDGPVIPRVGVPAMGGLVPLAPVPPRRPLQRDDTDRAERGGRRSRRPHVPASATAPIRRQSVYDDRLINPTDRPTRSPRPRRATVPSWDEVLFGTRTRSPD